MTRQEAAQVPDSLGGMPGDELSGVRPDQMYINMVNGPGDYRVEMMDRRLVIALLLRLTRAEAVRIPPRQGMTENTVIRAEMDRMLGLLKADRTISIQSNMSADEVEALVERMG